MPIQLFLKTVKKGDALLNKLYNLIYPRYCLHCDAPIEDVCPFCLECFKNIRRIAGAVCSLCHIPFVSEAATSHTPDHRCGDCRADPPLFSKAITPFYYQDPLKTAIQKFKYNKQTHLADFFVGLIRDDLIGLEVDGVIAIPLHPNRLRSREFNQSLLLAGKIADLIARPYSTTLIRIRETESQVGLSRKRRVENLKEAFFVSRPNDVKGQRILLVDDVYTTGTTLKEGAKALIDAGAKEVVVVAIARMI